MTVLSLGSLLWYPVRYAVFRFLTVQILYLVIVSVIPLHQLCIVFICVCALEPDRLGDEG